MTLRKAILFIGTIVFAYSAKAQADSIIRAAVTPTKTADSADTYVGEINKLILTADKELGTPYRFGGKQPGGFDCSGFVMYCYKKSLNINLGPQATYYYKYGAGVKREEARPGDVICFTGYNAANKVIGHVGIITEVTPTEIYFIHSALNGGIRYDQLGSAYYTQRYMGIRRILN